MADVYKHPGTPGSGAGRRVNMSPMISSGGYPRPPTRDKNKTAMSPMPDYMAPITKSATKRFFKLQEDHMMTKVVEKRNSKKDLNQMTKQEAKKIARKIPMEALAKDWLKESDASVETRAFLVDKVFPTLILGVEKLLIEAGNRKLTQTNETDPNFNPLNFLAQYLMRNNPRYSNFSEASPYIRSLREVTEELKKELFDIDENRLAKIKAEARAKREEREKEENLRQAEKTRRNDAIKKQYEEWDVGSYPDGRVEVALVQNALRSFAEKAENFPPELQEAAKFSHELEETDITGRTMVLREYVLYVNQFIDNMPSEVFDSFMEHMYQCSLSFRSQAERGQRKSTLTQLFFSCDHAGVGVLDRHRVLELFEMFYDKARTPQRHILRNPRRFPVIEVDEMEDSMYDSDSDSDEELDSAQAMEEASSASPPEPAVAAAEVKAEGEQEEQSQAAKVTNEAQPAEPQTEAPTEDQAKVSEEPAQGDQEAPPPTEEVKEATQETAGEVAKEEPPAEVKVEEGKEATSETEEKKDTEKQEEEKKEETKEEIPQKTEGEAEVKDEQKEADTKEETKETEGEADTSVTEADTSKDQELAKLEEQKSPDKQLSNPEESKVTFARGTTFEKERTLLTSHGSRSVSVMSMFDQDTLNVSQFTHITETFLGDLPSMDTFSLLVRYVKEGYMETEEERMKRLMKARMEARSAKRKALLNSLFEMWDNDGSGYVDLDDVETVMKKYKDGMEDEAIETAKLDFKSKSQFYDNRLSKREFREFVYLVCTNMAGDDAFDFFVEYLLNSVERSYTERVRGEARKKWLQQVITAAETSGGSMESVYKSVFQALYKDAEAHGQNKIISGSISMLERNLVAPQRGDHLLRYVATTTDDAHFLLGKCLYKDMRGISFAAVESGKPIHVPRVNNHGNIFFWNHDRAAEDPDGSFIVVPLKDRKKRVFGLVNVDTLRDPKSRAIFITHEIQFYQGVAKAFSIGYHYVDLRQKIMRISESAVSWIQRRSSHVHEILLYMVEPDGKGTDYVLRKMMGTDHKGNAIVQKSPPRLERKDNLFRDYLFKCVDNSESVTADAYGERHLAVPLRDDEGRAIVVIDISIGDMKQLPKLESREVMKMLKLLQMAYKEISREAKDTDTSQMLEGEKGDEDARTEILFDRLMLMELRENVSKLDAKAYAELKSYKEPPAIVHQILKAVLSIFYPDKAENNEFDEWTNCKQYVNPQLNHKILQYDPTTSVSDGVNTQLINKYLDEVPHGMVSKHGSIPAQFLYNWVFVCVSMIEHSRKMKSAKQQEDDIPAGEKEKSADNAKAGKKDS